MSFPKFLFVMCITAVTTAPADLAMGAKGQKIIINIIIIVVVIDYLIYLLFCYLCICFILICFVAAGKKKSYSTKPDQRRSF